MIGMVPAPALLVLGAVARVVLGLSLIESGASKLKDIDAFVFGVRQYRILPRRVARPAALALACAEPLLGIWILAGPEVQVAAGLAAALLVTFGIAVGVNLKRDRVIPCFCHGAGSDDLIGPMTLVREAAFVAVAWFIAGLAPVSWAEVMAGEDSPLNVVVPVLLFALLAMMATRSVREVLPTWRALRTPMSRPPGTGQARTGQ
jgi:uncharacterized membrane protein YphA (DoxX/SURF4 family)